MSAREARHILGSEGLSEAAWAARARVHRKQVHEFVRGANLRCATIEKLLAPVGWTLCGVGTARLADAARLLATVERFLEGLEPATGLVEKALLYLGLPVRGLSPQEIASARESIAGVAAYLRAMEENGRVDE